MGGNAALAVNGYPMSEGWVVCGGEILGPSGKQWLTDLGVITDVRRPIRRPEPDRYQGLDSVGLPGRRASLRSRSWRFPRPLHKPARKARRVRVLAPRLTNFRRS
jgi:hypothetical protein